MRIGILGGTFDPVHLGHVSLAKQALGAYALDQIWFVPARVSPYKLDTPPISAVHRVRMLQLAIRDYPELSVSWVDLERDGPSYTVDMLTILQKRRPFCRFFLIMGTDLMKDLPKWYKIKEILQIVDIITLERPGFDKGILPIHFLKKIHWIHNGIVTPISSTLIRDRLSQGISVQDMLSQEVWQYIKEYSLYGTNTSV